MTSFRMYLDKSTKKQSNFCPEDLFSPACSSSLSNNLLLLIHRICKTHTDGFDPNEQKGFVQIYLSDLQPISSSLITFSVSYKL